MTSWRYLAHQLIASGKATTGPAVAVALGIRRTQAHDVIQGLKQVGAIERDPAFTAKRAPHYRVVAGVEIPPDGRGRAPGCATGRKYGPKANARKSCKTPIRPPRVERMTALERCWLGLQA